MKNYFPKQILGDCISQMRLALSNPEMLINSEKSINAFIKAMIDAEKLIKEME